MSITEYDEELLRRIIDRLDKVVEALASANRKLGEIGPILQDISDNTAKGKGE